MVHEVEWPSGTYMATRICPTPGHPTTVDGNRGMDITMGSSPGPEEHHVPWWQAGFPH